MHPDLLRRFERAVFRNQEDSQAELARQQMGEMLKSPLASQPQDVAEAIWKMVRHPQAEIIVGSGAIATTIYKLAPSLSQWLMQRSMER